MWGVNFVFVFLALLAEILGTIGGFGSSVFFVPLGNFYFDFQSVLGIAAIFHLSSNLSKMLLFKQGLNWRLIWLMGIPSVVFVVLGGYLSSWVNGDYLEGVLAVFLLVFSVFFLLKKRFAIQALPKNALMGGALSGFSAGLLGTGGAIRGLTMAAFNLEKSAFIATSAVIDLMIDFSRTLVYYRNGFIHAHDLKYIPFLLLVGFIGSYLGKRMLVYIPQSKFRSISLLLILAIGIITGMKLLLGA
jgi:uncharacterized membrane protein YfcA